MTQPDPTLVSIIVLSFNRKRETLHCLKSIAEQDYQLLEIVVLDNGSKDGSAEAIAKEFPLIHLIRMPRNYGDWEGRDIALSSTSGEYVACIDNDAVINKRAISELTEAMNSDPKLAVVEPKVVDPKSGKAFSGTEPKISTNHYRSNFLGGASLYRRKALEEVGGFPHYLLGGAEVHLSLRFLDLGYRILHLGDTVLYHDMSPKERVPHQRFFLSAKQRLRAFMAHYPGFIRPAVDFSWKLGYYAVEGIRRGFILRVPIDLTILFTAGLKAWLSGDWRVKKQTLALMDYLSIYTVSSVEEYEKIDLPRYLIFRRIKSRLARDENQ